MGSKGRCMHIFLPREQQGLILESATMSVSIEQNADGWDDLIKFGPVKFNLENILAQNLLMNAWNEDN